MAKAIEQTPVLEGKDAERFLKMILSKKPVKLTKTEVEVHRMVRSLPKHLKL